jgi:predicted RNase H-like nuclease
MKFLGIDLGWKSQPSGLCYLEWQDEKLQLLDLDRKDSIADILTWVDTCVKPDESALIAVDAPTLIPNATGSRLPDKLTHKHFGKYHAGCYPANLNLPFADRTVNFGLELESRGYLHAPTIEPQKPGRYQIEVFPHPAIVHLFNLQRILKYKKGRLSDRRLELLKLYNYILDILPTLEPSVCLKQKQESALFPFDSCEFASCFMPGNPSTALAHFLLLPCTGATLKATEDKLDSLICAYVAAHWWYWGDKRNIVLGDRTTGYIVTPSLRS